MRVSVIVITYNSAQTIIDTLESIKSQTYKNIEILIADDCSKDNTVQICDKWLAENSLGNEVIRLYSKRNNGTVKNLNKAVRCSSGEYIQVIAGDDILYPDCVEKRLKYCIDNKVNAVFSKIFLFGNNKKMLHEYERNAAIAYKYFEKDSKTQLDEMLNGNWVLGPMGGFYARRMYDEIGGYDERIKLIEDSPYIFKMIERYGKLHFLDERLVKYRISNGSVSIDRNPTFYKDSIKITLYYKIPIYIKTRAFKRMIHEIIWCMSELL